MVNEEDEDNDADEDKKAWVTDGEESKMRRMDPMMIEGAERVLKKSEKKEEEVDANGENDGKTK